MKAMESSGSVASIGGGDQLNFCTVAGSEVCATASPPPPPPPPPTAMSGAAWNGLGVINHNYQDDSDDAAVGCRSSGTGQVPLIGLDCDQLAVASGGDAVASTDVQQQHKNACAQPSVNHSVVASAYITNITNNINNRKPNPVSNDHPYLLVNLNPVPDFTVGVHHRHSTTMDTPELSTNDKTKCAAINLNPVGPVEFVDRYRTRNSSQRSLVNDEDNINNNGGDGSSHSSGHKSPFGNDTASTAELKDGSVSPDLCTEEELDSDDPDALDPNDLMPERGQWSGQLDFIFSCISYAVGLGNVWRFPYLCYENGGGVFLIPYLICVCFLGVPLFVMEVGLGQYLQLGGVGVWNKMPILKGIGYASMVMIGLCNTYYIVIISWTLYYLFNSFKSPLPWSLCNQWWNTAACHEPDGSHNESLTAITPAEEFWNNNVLGITDDLAEVNHIQWHLFITLILAWILVYVVIYRGIHQSGKIIWFSAMFPYVILVILFGYGLSLEGSGNGISFYLTPKWEMLKEPKIWVAAGTQLLFTYGIGIGTNIALGSYNTFNHNFFRDSIIACLLSSGTSLFSGFVIFSVLGHLAWTLNTTVEEVAQGGPGLAFIVYPEAITRLPVPNLWACLFFVMLLVLGIDSQFCTVESFVTGIVDEWPRFLRPRRQLFTAVVVMVHFGLGLTMITDGGMYIFQLMDNYSASGISLIIVVLSEIIGFCWIYGGNNVYHNMCKMLGFNPPRVLFYIWTFVAPAILVSILTFSIVKYTPPDYAGKEFPWYGQMFGWMIASASILCIPGYMVYYLLWKSDRSLSLLERFLAGLSDANGPDSIDSSSTSTDMEKASNRDLLDLEQSHLSDHYHHAHMEGHVHHHHHHHVHHMPHMHLSKPYMSLGESNSTLSTSIADHASFTNSSVQLVQSAQN